MILSAAALVAVCFASCDKNGNTTNLDEAVEDGFYVAGEATGVNELKPAYMMTAGINEAADQTKRSGMYEKYIVLQGGKDFDLKLYELREKRTEDGREYLMEFRSTIDGHPLVMSHATADFPCVANIAKRAAVDIVSTVALAALKAETPIAVPAVARPATTKMAA